MNKLTEIFCDVDDFCTVFMPKWEKQLLTDGTRQRNRQGRMTMSEIMTIIIAFHTSNQRDFKNYYTGFIALFYKDHFPTLLSHTRFLAIMPTALTPLCAYFTHIKGKPTGISFVDSTSIKVCHNLRIERHKTFAGIAKRGRGTMGCFYGFKLHITVNHLGDILAANITPANVDDRKPVPKFAKELVSKLYADKGYIRKALADELFDKGVDLITNMKKNMKVKLISVCDRAMLSRRFIIETINDQLKNITQIEHSRHRSVHGFMLNIIAGLIAYSLKDNEPSLRINSEEFSMMTVF